MFEKVDERMGRGDTVFSIGQLQEAQTEEQEAERRRADDRQALLEDLKTATLPLYDANELQAQFQAVAAVQRSMAATTQTGELVPDAANVALSITDPQGRVLLLKSATDLPPGAQDSGWSLPVSKRQYTATSSEVALALYRKYGKAYGNDAEQSLTQWRRAQSGTLGDVDYFNVDVSLEDLSGTAPHSEFRLHTTDSRGNSTTNICAWFPLDDLPFPGMPAGDVGALQEHPRRCGKYTVAHVAKSTRNARGHYISTLGATSLHGPVGAHDEVGLFITEENDRVLAGR